MNDAELEELRRDVRYLKDRQAILDCVTCYARGCDRFDDEVLASAFHEDGVDEHGFTVNSGSEYPAWGGGGVCPARPKLVASATASRPNAPRAMAAMAWRQGQRSRAVTLLELELEYELYTRIERPHLIAVSLTHQNPSHQGHEILSELVTGWRGLLN